MTHHPSCRPLYALVALVCAIGFLPAHADYLEIRRNANLKEEPSSGAEIHAALVAGDLVGLLDDGQQVSGYYHVHSAEHGTDGWVYRTLVRRHAGSIPGDISTVSSGISHCPLGCPAGSPSANDLVSRELYTLSSNPQTKFADWVAYFVTEDTIGSTKTRTFKRDPLIDATRTLVPSDYDGAHAALKTDRGHQAPLASFTSTAHWKTTNFLSNITPQKSKLNNGVWKVLERKVRELAQDDEVEAVYVLTGTLYESDIGDMPGTTKTLSVPSGYWKVVMVEPGDTMSVAGFEFGQDTPSGQDVCDAKFRQTIDAIEGKTGLDLFPNYEASRETEIESLAGALYTEFGCES